MTSAQIALTIVLALISTALWEAAKRFLAWANARPPSPLSLEDKVKLAQQITQAEAYVQSLDRVLANPTELLLRLFRYGLGVVFLFMLATVLFALRGAMNNDVTIAFVCLLFVPVFGALAIHDSFALSPTKIAETRAKAQRSLDEAKAKLATHAIGVLPAAPVASLPLSSEVPEVNAKPPTRDESGPRAH